MPQQIHPVIEESPAILSDYSPCRAQNLSFPLRHEHLADRDGDLQLLVGTDDPHRQFVSVS